MPSKRRVLGQCVGTGSATKTEAIDLALRRLAGQPMSREEALAMRGAAASVLAHDRGFARIADVVDLTLDQYSIRA